MTDANEPVLWLFRNRYVSNPHDSLAIVDDEEDWRKLLDVPEVVADDDGKEAAQTLCGAKYLDEVKHRDKEGVEGVTCLVLDVDNSKPPNQHGVPTEECLRKDLEGIRCVVYTSPSHTTLSPRWRVLVPLASPCPPKKHRALVRFFSEKMFPEHPWCIDVASTGDPCRLGFVGVTKNPEDYKWWSQPGERLDWTVLELEDEQWLNAPLSGLERQPQWTDRATALQLALRAYAGRGYAGAKKDYRTMVLWHSALDLWWDWAAEDEDFVREVLLSINAQFPEAKEEEDVDRKLREAHDRTVGPNRKVQLRGPYGSKREPSNAVSKASIQHLAKSLRRSPKPDKARIGDEMLRMISGNQTIADDPNTWRSALSRVAQKLASTFIHDTPESIAQFFQGTLAAMTKVAGATAVPNIESITAWISVRIEGEKKRRAENQRRLADEVQRNIAFATGGERDFKYTPQEVDTWMADDGCGLTDRSWILVSGKSYYVFVNGTWVGPHTETEFDAQGYTELDAASDFIRTEKVNEETGVVSKIPLKQLLQKYGSKCIPVIDFHCERSFFRKEDKTLVIVGAPKNEIEPRFHADVDQWFRVLTGRDTPSNEKVRQEEAAATSDVDDYDALCNWLACVTQQDHVCSALVIVGSKGLGKNLLVDGVARIWTGGANTINSSLGHFNSLLSSSPLIHVDEGLPKGMSASVLLRRVLSQREHVVTKKYSDSVKLRGCIRILFTANNMNLLNRSGDEENLQRDDVDALADRFVLVNGRREAKQYLEALGKRRHDFVDRNAIAEHTLWLVSKRWSGVQARDLRFLVSGRDTNISDIVATNNPVASDACAAIADVLSTARQVDFCQVRDGQIWVNAALLRQHVNIQNQRANYTDKDVTLAVSSVSLGRKRVRVKNKMIRMWAFRASALKAWCTNTTVFEWSDVEDGISKLNIVGDRE